VFPFFPIARELDPDIECQLQIRNTERAEKTMRALFAQSGDVMAVRIFAIHTPAHPEDMVALTMSAQSEADTAVSGLDDHLFFGLKLKVSLVRARTLRGDLAT
jgi:hypothetical protein